MVILQIPAVMYHRPPFSLSCKQSRLVHHSTNDNSSTNVLYTAALQIWCWQWQMHWCPPQSFVCNCWYLPFVRLIAVLAHFEQHAKKFVQSEEILLSLSVDGWQSNTYAVEYVYGSSKGQYAYLSLSAKGLSIVCKMFIKLSNTAIWLCHVRVVTYHDASSHSHTQLHILQYIFHTQAKD